MSESFEPVRVLLIVASVRRPRTADTLVPWVRAELLARRDLATEVLDLAELGPDDLPMQGMGGASPVAEQLMAADAFVLLVPEYNHSFPASLKNLVDWHHAEWAGKPVTFVSYGASSGGIRATEQLRLVFPELRAVTTRNTVALSSPWRDVVDGEFVPREEHRGAMKATLDELAWWAVALRDARLAHGTP